MSKFSQQEKIQYDSAQILSLLQQVRSISSKADAIQVEIDKGLQSVELTQQIEEIMQQIAALNAYGKVIGANITVSTKEPDNPSEYDIWFDPNLGVK